VRHPLLVTPLIDPHFAAVLFQRLAQPQHVAVAKDRENAFDELMLFAIDFQVLVIEELHQRLRHCQSQFAHVAQSLLFSICVWVRADAAGEIVNVTGILLDYRQTFFSLNRNTEEIFHFARGSNSLPISPVSPILTRFRPFLPRTS
jgi:myo-inositol catabolism protein IolC